MHRKGDGYPGVALYGLVVQKGENILTSPVLATVAAKWHGTVGPLQLVFVLQPGPTQTVARLHYDLNVVAEQAIMTKSMPIHKSANRSKERATLAEKEANALKEQLATSQPKGLCEVLVATMSECESPTVDVIARHNLDGEVASKDKEISKLMQDVQRLQSSISSIQETTACRIARLEEELEQQRQHNVVLESKLEAMGDYEQLKREISLLRSMEMSSPIPTEQRNLDSDRSKMSDEPLIPPKVEPPSEDGGETSPLPTEEVEPEPAEKTDEDRAEEESTRTPTPHDPYLNGKLQDDCHNNNHLSQLMANPILSNGLMGLNHHGLMRSELCMDVKNFRFEDRYRFGDETVMGRLGESLIPKGDPMEARLQEMLRFNMDKYSTQNLDTLHIARRVRELLSIHNIGQRLFAKYVLGLSQGTVSELLSKPKPWDKLTEKGRDSYRKMHAWACDENAVMLLKSLIPKKAGKEGSLPFGRDVEPSNLATDERIAHILTEAATIMNAKQSEDANSHEEDSKSPNCPSPLSLKDSNLQRRVKKYDNDDIPQDKVARIYQEELVKLVSRGQGTVYPPHSSYPPRLPMRPGHPFPTLLFPHFFGPPGPMDRSQEEMRMVVDAYHRELAKLNCPSPGLPGAGMPGPGLPGLLALQQQHQQHQPPQQHPPQPPQQPSLHNGAQDLSLPKERRSDTPASQHHGSGDRERGGPQAHRLVNGVAESGEGDKESKKEGASILADATMADGSRHGSSASAFSLVRPKTEPDWPPGSSGSTASSPLSNTILPPVLNPSDDLVTSSAASPLQRMASITNSLISQPSVTPHHTTNQRPLKAVLPPITQQQFDMFNNLNTEDIVKRVKEQLSQYSISQRLFGESVLGLSQGSVSDLLARPKPWHMLTQKGREPFIRMKMFLEDDNAVHKLVASQYKIAPEKLMRTGGYGGATINPPQLTPKHQMQSQKHTEQLSSMAANLAQQHQERERERKTLERERDMLRETILPPTLNIIPPPNHMLAATPTLDLKKSHHPVSNMRALQQHISPSVYEMAALTQDLDTQVITTKIKEALLANNIGQKIFGEAVLGLSQGSVSELLSKPKPWHMLSIKGREPFIRMQLWLSDSHNIDRLQALKNERRELNKRRRSSGHGGDNSSDTSSNDTAEFYHSTSPGPAKKQRVLFSEDQKEALRLAFNLDPYPNVATIEFLANELGLSSRTITNWFHNHRMRLKQQVPHSENAPRDPPQPFDPVQFRALLNQRLMDVQKERLGLGSVPLPYAPYNLATLNMLANAAKEQFGGLDLTLKREPFDDESDMVSEDSNSSSGTLKNDLEEDRMAASSRPSRRKPAAPQWVNPEWQEEKPKPDGEVIINGVCVMQTDDFSREKEQETIRIEPTPVLDRFEQSEESSDEQNNENVPNPTPEEPCEQEKDTKATKEEGSWEY